MKDNTPAANESSGMTTVEVPKDEYEELKQLAEVGKLVEIRAEGDDPALEDIWLAGQPVGKIIESNRKKASEAQSSTDEPTGKTGKDGSDDSEMLPIERIARMKDGEAQADPSVANTTASVERAITIFQHFGEWSSKAKAGRVIRDNLKNLLTTATGESLAWKQVYRACRKLEEWSKGAIEFIQHDRHGWILVGQSSSVGNG